MKKWHFLLAIVCCAISIFFQNCCMDVTSKAYYPAGLTVKIDSVNSGFASADYDTVYLRTRQDKVLGTWRLEDTFIYIGNNLFKRLFQGKTISPVNLIVHLLNTGSDTAELNFGAYKFGLFGIDVKYSTSNKRCEFTQIVSRYIRLNGVVGDLEKNVTPAPFYSINNGIVYLKKP